MSFAVIRRIIDEEDRTPEDSEVRVDLKVSGTTELEKAAETIRAALAARKAPDVNLLTKQFSHIKNELKMDKTLPFSLEHLELFQQFLSRIITDSLPGELRELHGTLCQDVQALLKKHPLAGEDRSGDKAGNENEITYVKIPARRRRQMSVMLYCNLLTGPALTMFALTLLWYLIPFSNYLVLAYVAWVTYDNMTRPMPAPKRVVQAWRTSGFYQLFRDYFPLRTMLATRAETNQFDASGHYLFCYHPHGVQSAGAFAFASVASGFDELFPGLTCSVQTLSMNFKFPVTRENLIALGAGDASKACLLNALRGSPGSSAMLVTGGAKESMYAHPGDSRVVMKDRMGFVKVAMTAGASLVPVWGFGENNLYENLAVKSPTVRWWQRRLQKAISFAPLLMEGRGVFSYSGGLIPHRRPISVVVGDPIPTGEANPNPTNEQIAAVHKRYQEALMDLFNTHKDIYDPKAEPLQFV